MGSNSYTIKREFELKVFIGDDYVPSKWVDIYEDGDELKICVSEYHHDFGGGRGAVAMNNLVDLVGIEKLIEFVSEAEESEEDLKHGVTNKKWVLEYLNKEEC